MKKNYITILLFAFISAFGINQLSAQESESKTKVVVVEKTIDKDGNVKVKKTIKEGKEAKAYLNKTEKEIEIHEKAEKTEYKDKDVKVKNHIKIVTTGDGGEENVFEWKGDGDIPEEMTAIMEKATMKEEKVFVELDNNSKTKVIVKILDGDDEEEIIIDLDNEGEIHEIIDVDDIEFVNVVKRDNNRKAQLGVIIEDSKDGVLINEIIEGSAAEKAGLKSGDIIQKINNIEITDIQSLVDSIKDRDPSESIDVVYLRGGELLAKKIQLQKYDSSKYEFKDEDVHEKMIIIKKKD